MKRATRSAALLAALLSSGQEAPPSHPALEDLRLEAERLEPLVETRAARELLAAVDELPAVEERTIYRATTGGYLADAFTAEQYAELDAEARAELGELRADTRLWYYTFYGSPLASVRAFDLAAQLGISTYANKRVLDFGFGSIGQLRLLAACGADVVGTEVMPTLRALYAGGARGTDEEVAGASGLRGRLRMVFGRWPAEVGPVADVGGGLDLFLSKNTIKRGYVAPPIEVPAASRLDLGVEHDAFLDALLAALRPGGLVLFYNLGGEPAAEGEPYRPPTDIASPWSRETYESHGFEVLALDEDDTEMAREVGFALGWEESMDLDDGLFARYTALRRPE